MIQFLQWILGLLFGAFLFGNLAGCEQPAQTQEALLFLQQGKARGSLTLVVRPELGFGMETRFFGGADQTTAAFHGDINFANTELSVPPFPAQPPLPEDQPPPDVEADATDTTEPTPE